MPFKPLENTRPFLKMGINGFAGDGKSFTAAVIAAGLHHIIRSNKPIAIYDTEKASKALKGYFRDQGIEAIVDDDNRSLKAWTQAVRDCEAGAADILITDSVTHIWEHYIEAYKEQKGKSRLSMEDWGYLKPKWRREFSETFVQANVNIIFTGRAGYEYDSVTDDKGKKEIFKSGVKMKAEGETAFEPDVLILMEQVEKLVGYEKKIYRIATVQKDRSRKIDGLVINQDGKKLGPEFADFEPAISYLMDGATVKNRVPPSLIRDTFENGVDPEREAKQTVIAEIGGVFRLMGWNREDDSHRQLKAWTLKQIWGDASLERTSQKPVKDLELGLKIMNHFAESWNKYMDELKASDGFIDREHVKKLMNEAKYFENAKA